MTATYLTNKHQPEDDGWEDIPDGVDDTLARSTETSARSPSPTTSSLNSTTRKRRKAGQRTVFVAAPPPKPYPASHTLRPAVPSPSKPRPRKQLNPKPLVSSDVQDALSTGAIETLRYALEILTTSFRLLKIPIALLVTFYLLSFVLVRLSNTVSTALAPLCTVPGLGRLCHAPSSSSPFLSDRPPQWADYPRLVSMQGQTLGALLEETASGPGLALEIKQAEMATADLATLVRVSHLTSREHLADLLVEFVQDARTAGRSLSRFSSRVGGAVDSVIAANDHALHTIEAASSRSNALSVLWPFGAKNEAAAREAVMNTFASAMSVLSTNMARLVLEAEASATQLENLEARLGVLHELVAREDGALAGEREELLAALWTKLGGNRRKLAGVDGHRVLLAGVGGYRARALAHVVAALQTLQGMSDDMEELRERVAAPELVGERIPVEVHVRSIRAGLERLQERRVKAGERQERITEAVLGGRLGIEAE